MRKVFGGFRSILASVLVVTMVVATPFCSMAAQELITETALETIQPVFEDPAKSGYTFDGWYSVQPFVTGVTTIKAGSAGTVTPYEKLLSVTSEDSTKTLMSNTYKAALKNAGKKKNFSGYCGSCVAHQMKVLGVTKKVESHDGKNYFKNFSDGKKTSGGYKIKLYSRTEYGTLQKAVDAIDRDGYLAEGDGKAVALACFQTGSGTTNGQKYGHVLMMYRIYNGKVYYTESSGTTERSDTIESFTRNSPVSKCSTNKNYGERKNSSGKTLYKFQGIVVLYK